MGNNSITKVIKIFDPEVDRPLYSRDFLNSEIGQTYLRKIYYHNKDEKNSNKIKIKCMCIDGGVPMHVKSTKSGFTVATNPNRSNLHDTNCENYIPTQSISPGIDKNNKPQKVKPRENDSDKEMILTLNSHSFYDKETKANDNTSPHKRTKATSSKKHANKNNLRYSYLFKRGELLLNSGWYNHILEYDYLPKDKNIFWNIYHNLSKHKINNATTFEDIMYSPYKHHYIKEKGAEIDDLAIKAYFSIKKTGEENNRPNTKMYILMKLDSLSISSSGKTIKMILVEPLNSFKCSLYTNAKYFKKKREKIKLKSDDIDIYVSAEAYVEDTYLYTKSMDFVPVFKDRAFNIRSSKDLQFTKELVKENVLFYRPSIFDKNAYDIWNGYVPDYLILNKHTKDPVAITEVFEELTLSKEKMGFYNNHIKDLKLLYWKAYENKPIPKWIIKKAKKLSQQKTRQV